MFPFNEFYLILPWKRSKWKHNVPFFNSEITQGMVSGKARGKEGKQEDIGSPEERQRERSDVRGPSSVPRGDDPIEEGKGSGIGGSGGQTGSPKAGDFN